MPSMVGVMADSYNKPAVGGNPFTMVAWHAAYWASDPAWTPPANGAIALSWRDGSGNARDMSTVSGNAPIYRATESTLNNKPALEFNGTNGYMAATVPSVSQPYSMVAVFRPVVVTGDRYVVSAASATGLGINAAGNWHLYAGSDLVGTAANTTPHFVYALPNAASSTIKVDGVQVAAGNAGGITSTTQWRIASWAGGATNCEQGPYGFVGFKAGALTTQEEANLLAWSRSFYGTP